MPSTPKAPRNQQNKQEHNPATSRGVQKPHRKHLTPAEAKLPWLSLQHTQPLTATRGGFPADTSPGGTGSSPSCHTAQLCPAQHQV